MHCVCYNIRCMGVLLQVREVPDDVHRKLKARAALEGVSLSEYVRGVLTRTASRPTPAELAARIRTRGSMELSEPSEAIVRSIRERGE
jgi:antitoxin FitA